MTCVNTSKKGGGERGMGQLLLEMYVCLFAPLGFSFGYAVPIDQTQLIRFATRERLCMFNIVIFCLQSQRTKLIRRL